MTPFVLYLLLTIGLSVGTYKRWYWLSAGCIAMMVWMLTIQFCIAVMMRSN